MHPDTNNEPPDRFHRADHFTDRPDRRGVSSLLKHAAVASALVVLAAAGLVAGVATTNAADNQSHASKATSRVTVIAREFSFKLSKRSVPRGTVIFTVVNKGKITHNFKIAGKTTRKLNPGQKATLKVKFTKKRRYAYLCTIPGHAKLGMKGVFSVGLKAVTPPPTKTTTPTTTPPPTTTTGPIGSGHTTVQVGMFEYRFDLSQSTMPSGQVTFVITNKGQQVHNFDILGVKVGKLLSPGQSETWTIALPAGGYSDQCDVPFHAGYGMVGSFTVTP
jgi:uncharacterized cupredoxin-like copper-binding protein